MFIFPPKECDVLGKYFCYHSITSYRHVHVYFVYAFLLILLVYLWCSEVTTVLVNSGDEGTQTSMPTHTI